MNVTFTHRIGTDLVEVQKFEKLLAERDELEKELFSAEEIRYARRKSSPYQHLASRFAAKEALFKALGTGLSGAMAWNDVEVRKERSGKPFLHLSGKTADLAREMGLAGHQMSMSHIKDYAFAMVVLVITE